MKRIFLFSVPSLQFEKKDLNVSYSDNRIFIGQLSRMITNSIFLSHSLRQDIIIRILVSHPIPHLIEIKSDTIRYLGPDERSSASLLDKVERFVSENFTQQGQGASEKWFEPNPGIKVKKTADFFADLEYNTENNVSLIQISKHKTEDLKSINSFSNELKKIVGTNDIIFLHADLAIKNTNEFQSRLTLPNNNWKEQIIHLPLNYDTTKSIGLFNLILDELE